MLQLNLERFSKTLMNLYKGMQSYQKDTSCSKLENTPSTEGQGGSAVFSRHLSGSILDLFADLMG